MLIKFQSWWPFEAIFQTYTDLINWQQQNIWYRRSIVASFAAAVGYIKTKKVNIYSDTLNLACMDTKR